MQCTDPHRETKQIKNIEYFHQYICIEYIIQDWKCSALPVKHIWVNISLIAMNIKSIQIIKEYKKS